mgnify:CR=1 FL=1
MVGQIQVIPLELRFLSALFTALPAGFFGACSATLFAGEYFYTTYLVVSGVFLVASIGLGFFLPARLQKTRLNRPWLWIVVQGSLAWRLAMISQVILNLTPLCVGQDNGDGTNTLGMCILISTLTTLAFSILIFMMYAFSASIGGQIIAGRLRTHPD